MPSNKSSKQKKTQSSPRTGGSVISAQERERMIAEAAYYNAEHRGFQRGDPEQDWFQAEEQIARQIHC